MKIQKKKQTPSKLKALFYIIITSSRILIEIEVKKEVGFVGFIDKEKCNFGLQQQQ